MPHDFAGFSAPANPVQPRDESSRRSQGLRRRSTQPRRRSGRPRGGATRCGLLLSTTTLARGRFSISHRPLSSTQSENIVAGLDGGLHFLGRRPEASCGHLFEAGPPLDLPQCRIDRLGLAGKAKPLDHPVQQLLINVHGHLHAMLRMACRSICSPAIGNFSRPSAQEAESREPPGHLVTPRAFENPICATVSHTSDHATAPLIIHKSLLASHL